MATVMNWWDLLHVGFGAPLLLLLLFLGRHFFHRRNWHAEEQFDEDSPPVLRPLRVVLMSTFACVFALALLWLGLAGLERIPGLYRSWYDRDRERVEASLHTLEQAGNFEEAGNLIRDRLRKRLSAGWCHSLAGRLSRDLIEVGKRRGDVDGSIKFLTAACEVNRQYGLDDALSVALLEQAQRDRNFAARMGDHRSAGRWNELANEIRAEMNSRPRTQWRYPLAEWLFDGLVALGRVAISHDEKVKNFRAALQVAAEYELKPELAASLLQLADTELKLAEERVQPARLPPGAIAGIARLSASEFPPVLGVDVWVEDPSGIPIVGLAQKDFRVLTADQTALAVTMAAVRVQGRRKSVILLMDGSASITQAALASARSGGKTLLSGLTDPNLEVEILFFQTEVSRKQSWTSNMAEAAGVLDALSASGKTALLAALQQALDDFKERVGEKIIVLFTDGANTVDSAVPVTDIVKTAKQTGVRIFTIGLRTHDLDSRTLRALADDTGGEYHEAPSDSELVSSFRRISRQIRPNIYRLVITPAGGTTTAREIPIRVRVGGENATVAEGIVTLEGVSNK